MNSNLLKLYQDLKTKGIIKPKKDYDEAIEEIENQKKAKDNYQLFKSNMSNQERKDFESCFE